MNDRNKRDPKDAGTSGLAHADAAGFPEEAGNPITQQMNAVGRRRREAEEKLFKHLKEAEHLDDEAGEDDRP
ncbi:hypothetical protein [Arthrobacter sp. ISL-30]|uniref:hypothetical protein n=1 Tax=Arthrobacter sp. ISL-30 TaxID=2819109 RepID=UPI001BECA60C|nr:hypothetical protein [Arthrobacter sp. ISL-30]MBT2514135.1 hypothetical protein [Arthrobacter sp. ISL-30]